MHTLTFRRWLINYDPEATRQAYADIDSGGTDLCTCVYCKNYAAVRDRLFPSEALDLLHTLGIDHHKEVEVYEASATGASMRFYGGWFHFVGSVELVGDTEPLIKLSGTQTDLSDFASVNEHFAIRFSTEDHLVHKAFAGLDVATLHFAADVPWVLDVPAP